MVRGETKLANRTLRLKESATLALNAKAKAMAAAGKTVYNLTAGELATDTPEYIQEFVSDKLKFNKYTPVAGLPGLRESVAAHAKQFYNLAEIHTGNVVVTGGVKPALCASFLAILDPGDEVIIPTPAWLVSYRPLVELAGGKVVEVPLDEPFDLEVAKIEAALTPKTKAIVLNSPNNPTGSIFSIAKLKQLADLLRGKSIYVISDDIYSQLVFKQKFMPTPAAAKFENLIIVNGFSKSQALTGWRIGYLIASQPIAQAANNLLSHITGNASLPGQYAALAALKRADQPPASTLQTLSHNRRLVSQALKRMNGVSFVEPAGAFYFFINVSELTHDTNKWCDRLLSETSVALVPGDSFGAPDFVRLTFVSDQATITAALEAIRKFIGD